MLRPLATHVPCSDPVKLCVDELDEPAKRKPITPPPGMQQPGHRPGILLGGFPHLSDHRSTHGSIKRIHGLGVNPFVRTTRTFAQVLAGSPARDSHRERGGSVLVPSPTAVFIGSKLNRLQSWVRARPRGGWRSVFFDVDSGWRASPLQVEGSWVLPALLCPGSRSARPHCGG